MDIDATAGAVTGLTAGPGQHRKGLSTSQSQQLTNLQEQPEPTNSNVSKKADAARH
ncbi:hypothetical protein LN650_19795 [Klebsiella pneumoniae subsp. pneumoniae]|nr:hypothetical protein [Klebsiella pneumoniae subsp. pneumoniae]